MLIGAETFDKIVGDPFTDSDEAEEQPDLFDDPSDMALLQLLLRDLHDELPERTARYRYLIDISQSLGPSGTILFGGSTSYNALSEARSSFVNGNYIATILLCQSLAESTLAGFLHVAGEDLPPKVTFHETLARCQSKGMLAASDFADLKRLAALRNPLSHFRDVNDQDNLARRSMIRDEPVEDLLSKDAHFAIATAIRLLANRPFRVG